jgi:aminoglycoside phosphotransferase (APT) family kinase protein
VANVNELQRSSREPDALKAGLESWLAHVLPPRSEPEVTAIEGTGSTGLSSETLLFDASWRDGGALCSERLVARLAPFADDVPVFPTYELDKQATLIRLVGELTDVPVPTVRWSETDPTFLGVPFFVMERLDGTVPTDLPPYTFGGWLVDANPDDRRRLQDAVVGLLARLHDIDRAEERFGFLEYPTAGATALQRHVAQRRAWYEWSVADGRAVGGQGGQRSELVDSCFAWLADHLPDDPSVVLSWGDSRIGNIMFRDYQPVGVFDWEMAGLAPQEVDLGWLLYAHHMFQHLADGLGMPGTPDLFRPDEVATAYERLTGHTPRHLEAFVVYAATQFAIVGLRTGARSVYFGEREKPDDIDDLLFNRDHVEGLLAGRPLV